MFLVALAITGLAALGNAALFSGNSFAEAPSEETQIAVAQFKQLQADKFEKASQNKAEISFKSQKSSEAKKAHEEKLAEEQRQAEAAKQTRAVAMNRSQSSGRATGGSGTKAITAYTDALSENGGNHYTADGSNIHELVKNGGNYCAANDYPLGAMLEINGKVYKNVDRVGSNGIVDILVGDPNEAAQIGRSRANVNVVQ